MARPRTEDATSRCGILKLAGLGTAASGAVLVIGKHAEADAAPPATGGCRETDPVKARYASARF